MYKHERIIIAVIAGAAAYLAKGSIILTAAVFAAANIFMVVVQEGEGT